jgi:hypothetical protein
LRTSPARRHCWPELMRYVQPLFAIAVETDQCDVLWFCCTR